MVRAGQIIPGIVLALLTVFCLDASIDLWSAIGIQSDVCGYVESLNGSDKTQYSRAIKKAYKIACGTANTPITRVNVMGMRMALSPDQAMFGIIALFGGVGGTLYSLGQLLLGRPDSTATVSSLLRPFAASALAVVFYVILRALFLPPGNLASSSPYGFLAIAALTGYFVDLMLAGLKTVVATLCHTGKGS